MADAVGAARLLLVVVFGVAAAGKFADRPAAIHAARAFGVTPALVRPIVVLLPVAEAAIATALLISATAPGAGVAAAALLVLFSVGISVNLARGNHPPCHCFGQVHAAPIGTMTLVRNAVLVVLAGAVVRSGPGTLVSWWTAGAVCGSPLAWFVWRRKVRGSTDDAPALLQVGHPAPPFSLRSTAGRNLRLTKLLALGRPVFIVFTSSNCVACAELLPDVARWQSEHAKTLTFVVIGEGKVATNLAKFQSAGIENGLVQDDAAVARAYGYKVAPCAVVVSPGATIASPLVVGADAIRQLVAHTVTGDGRDVVSSP